MATLTVQAKSNTSPLVTWATAAEAGDQVAHASRQKLLIQNNGSVDMDVTIASEVAESGPTGTGPFDWVVTVTPGELAVLDISSTNFKDESGNVVWTYESHEDILVAVVTVG